MASQNTDERGCEKALTGTPSGPGKTWACPNQGLGEAGALQPRLGDPRGEGRGRGADAACAPWAEGAKKRGLGGRESRGRRPAAAAKGKPLKEVGRAGPVRTPPPDRAQQRGRPSPSVLNRRQREGHTPSTPAPAAPDAGPASRPDGPPPLPHPIADQPRSGHAHPRAPSMFPPARPLNQKAAEWQGRPLHARGRGPPCPYPRHRDRTG